MLIDERLIVFSPAKVIADTTRKRESTYETLRGGVDEPQKTTLVMRETPMK